MNRYEVTFVIQTDMEDVGSQPWWLINGEEPFSPEFLEYILVRDMKPDENVLDAEPVSNVINVIDMVTKETPKPELKLVVNNGEKDDEQTHKDV